MAGFKQENRVGSGASTPTPTPTPTPTGTKKPKLGTFDASKIVAQFQSQTGVQLGGNAGRIGAGGNLIDSMSTSQRTALAKLLKKLGHNVTSVSEMKTTLNAYYVNEYNASTNYEALYSSLAADYIPGMETGAGASNLPTQTITQYSDDQLKSITNTITQNFLGKNISDADWKLVQPKLRALVEKGTTTTTKQVGGKNVVTVSPGFSQQAAQTIIEKQLGQTAQQDLQVKQYQDNLDWLSQNMAGM